jgi:flavin-dependent thymidylate synthase
MKDIKVELQEWMGSDRKIAEAAWTSSFDLEKKLARNDDDVKRVVNLLADSKHSVPFESVIFRFWIKLPIQIDRQHMTHRIGSHSGMSGRYRTMPSEFQEVPNDIKAILTKHAHYYDYVEEYNERCEKANTSYNLMVSELKQSENAGRISNKEMKRAREFFRGMLPQNNMTERVTVMNLRSFANYYKLRSKPDAQPEIQHISNLMLEQVRQKNICPIAIEALEKNSWAI